MRYLIGIVLILCVISCCINEGGALMAEQNEAWKENGYKVKSVLNDGQIKLSNNKIVKLAGIEYSSLGQESIAFIKELTRNKVVAFKPDEYLGELIGYLYVLGVDKDFLPRDFGNDGLDVIGFLGLKIGFNKFKGLGKNLNSILIKKCLVSPDLDSKYELKDVFLKYKDTCG